MYKQVLLMLNDVGFWINIQLEQNSSSKSADVEYEDYSESDLIVVWETVVQPLTDVQRIILFSFTIFVAVIAVLGNILVLYVNFSRFAKL